VAEPILIVGAEARAAGDAAAKAAATGGAVNTGSGTRALADRGVSLWLDDLSRDRIVGGGLQRLIAEADVTGVTTNPTIFATALRDSSGYEDEIRRLAAGGASPEDAGFELMTGDVAAAADILRPVHEATGGDDGWVSIEVSAAVAHDPDATLREARRLARRLDRPNVFVKIPATRAGLEAISAAVGEGISVNVTLVFSVQRYDEVVEAYLSGLERAAAAGLDLARIHSVASFFVSRVDAEVDGRLARIGSVAAAELTGAVAIANCRLALDLFARRFAGERAQRLLALGAHPQRLLWASTGVKDPCMADTRYVDELVAPGVVITMPEATLRAVADHSRPGDLTAMSPASARAALAALADTGISYIELTDTLERRGIEQFERSGGDLLDTLRAALATAGGAA
jgi:transaldolase